MADHYRQFVTELERIGHKPVDVRLSDRRAWQLKLDDGYVLELGRQDMAARLARFVSAYGQTIVRLPAGTYRVDLRYPNGFAVRVPGVRWADKAV
jgi:cell division protein FtsQ